MKLTLRDMNKFLAKYPNFKHNEVIKRVLAENTVLGGTILNDNVCKVFVPGKTILIKDDNSNFGINTGTTFEIPEGATLYFETKNDGNQLDLVGRESYETKDEDFKPHVSKDGIMRKIQYNGNELPSINTTVNLDYLLDDSVLVKNENAKDRFWGNDDEQYSVKNKTLETYILCEPEYYSDYVLSYQEYLEKGTSRQIQQNSFVREI